MITSFEIDFLEEMRNLLPRISLGLLLSKPREDLFDVASRIGLEYICLNHDIVTGPLVLDAQKLGFKVYAYGVQNSKDMARMRRLKVNDVCTDFPELGK